MGKKNKNSLTKEQKIALTMKAMATSEDRAKTWLDTKNIGLRESKYDRSGIKPNNVSDDILRDYLRRIENKEQILDVYIKEA